MSEELLQAIIRLLAIVAVEGEVTPDERNTIKKFLEENLSKGDVLLYLKLFDRLTVHLGASEISRSDDREQIHKITEKFNQEFTRQQKTVVMMVLMELILADGKVTDREKELLYFTAESFNISSDEVEDMKSFLLHNERTALASESVLLADDGSLEAPPNEQHVIVPELEGFIAVLRMKTVGMYFIKYVGPAPIFLNGVPLKEGKTFVFPPGSTIRGKKIIPVFYSDIVKGFKQESEESRISFIVENVSYKFSNGTFGVQHINMQEESGRLVGIMGSSGTGKSTLLNVLNGHEKPLEGKVLINDIDIHKNPRHVEGVIGYVPQFDALIEELSVYQNLHYAAKLCYRNKSRKEIKELVNHTLNNLGLMDIKDLRVGSRNEKAISGGQRKRLNIGLELLREPSVLFVDEPTSGLSSRDSENIMDLLKELTHKGKLVFVVIHQPSSDLFKMFDKLTILDVGGRQIYYGNPIQAVTYFKRRVNMVDKEQGSCVECGNVNPEQIFSIIEAQVVNEYGQFTNERKISPETWREYYETHLEEPRVEPQNSKPKTTLRIPNKVAQTFIFASRDLLAKFSNRQYLIVALLEAPVLALILAFIVRYYPQDEHRYVFSNNDNIPAFFFMSVIVALFMGLMISAEEIFRDRKIMKRESFLNLSKGSYLFSKIWILFAFSAVQTITFALIGHWVLDIKGMTFAFWMVLFSTSCFANILGLNISSAFNSAVTIYIIIPLLIIPQLILSGVVVNFDKLNPQIASRDRVPLVGNLMTSRWAFEALMVNQFKENPYERQFYAFDKDMASSEFKTVYFIPKLEAELAFIYQHYGSSNPNVREDLEEKITLVRNEFMKELKIFGTQHFPEFESLTLEEFNSAIYEEALNFLRQLKKVYNARYNEASDQKDQLMAGLNDTEEKRRQFMLQKDNFQNKKTKEMLKNRSSADRLLIVNNSLVQKLDPIYQDPDGSSFPMDFNAQFYTPKKYFFGKHIETIYFNVIIIWMMSIILFITLYFDLPRKAVSIVVKQE